MTSSCFPTKCLFSHWPHLGLVGKTLFELIPREREHNHLDSSKLLQITRRKFVKPNASVIGRILGRVTDVVKVLPSGGGDILDQRSHPRLTRETVSRATSWGSFALRGGRYPSHILPVPRAPVSFQSRCPCDRQCCWAEWRPGATG